MKQQSDSHWESVDLRTPLVVAVRIVGNEWHSIGLMRCHDGASLAPLGTCELTANSRVKTQSPPGSTGSAETVMGGVRSTARREDPVSRSSEKT
jgi:hypothetical protein